MRTMYVWMCNVNVQCCMGQKGGWKRFVCSSALYVCSYIFGTTLSSFINVGALTQSPFPNCKWIASMLSAAHVRRVQCALQIHTSTLAHSHSHVANTSLNFRVSHMILKPYILLRLWFAIDALKWLLFCQWNFSIYMLLNANPKCQPYIMFILLHIHDKSECALAFMYNAPCQYIAEQERDRKRAKMFDASSQVSMLRTLLFSSFSARSLLCSSLLSSYLFLRLCRYECTTAATQGLYAKEIVSFMEQI